jgi:hypothetical protein
MRRGASRTISWSRSISRPGRTICALLSLAALLCLVRCGGTPPPTRLRDMVGTVAATLTLIPDLPVPMQDTTVEVELQDDGQPVIGAKVRLTLTMPSCPMAPNHLELQDAGDGLYRVQTVLTMAGAWQADASVTFPDGEDAQLTFFFATR